MARMIGFDLDDVLMDFNTGLCVFHNAHYGTSLVREDITSYHLEETWGCDREECIRRVGEFYNSPEHDATQPILGAVKVVHELQKDGASVVVITSRPESMSDQTFSWLKKHFPSLAKANSVHFTSHFFHKETGVTKSDICRNLGVKVFVDDAPFHVQDVAPVVEEVLLFDAPWNRGYVLTLQNIRRVHSWSEIHKILNRKS